MMGHKKRLDKVHIDCRIAKNNNKNSNNISIIWRGVKNKKKSTKNSTKIINKQKPEGRYDFFT
jgi:hypothetical protein